MCDPGQVPYQNFFLTCKMTPFLPIFQGYCEVNRVNINCINHINIEYGIFSKAGLRILS